MKNKKKKASRSVKRKSAAKRTGGKTVITPSSILGILIGLVIGGFGLYGAVAQNNPLGYIFVLFGAIVIGFVLYAGKSPKRK